MCHAKMVANANIFLAKSLLDSASTHSYYALSLMLSDTYKRRLRSGTVFLLPMPVEFFCATSMLHDR